jgi:hypothetical protein
MASSVFVWSKNKVDIRDGNEYKIRKWLVLKFHGSGHLPKHTSKKFTSFIKYLEKNPEGLYKIELCRLPLRHRLFLSCDSHEITIVLKNKRADWNVPVIHLNKITMFENDHFQNCVYFWCFFQCWNHNALQSDMYFI